MQEKLPPQKIIKILILVIFLAIITNLLILDYSLIKRDETKIYEKETIAKDVQPKANLSFSKDQLSSLSTELTDCPTSCISKINEATSSLKLTSEKASEANNSPTQNTFSGIKEFFIPLGSGAAASKDWADVSGVQAYIDSSMYGQIKSVVFEPSVYIPTGNQTVWVRLYNITDKHPVWYSEVSIDGGLSRLLFSQNISLDQGNKLYQVQLKTSLGYISNVEQARVHITTY